MCLLSGCVCDRPTCIMQLLLVPLVQTGQWTPQSSKGDDCSLTNCTHHIKSSRVKKRGTSLLMNVPLAVMMAGAGRQIELQAIGADM